MHKQPAPLLLNGTCAFLKKNGCYLLMKRSMQKKIAPGLWSGIGGHMEASELNDPLATCLREIKEETGIPPENIHDLQLRYLLLRQAGTVIRQSYIFFGETDADDLQPTDEGELFWIPENELLQRTFSQTFTAMLAHYTTSPDTQCRVVAGVAGNENGRLRMHWSVLEDFEKES